MAPFATLYTTTNLRHPRSLRIRACANINGLELYTPEYEMGVTNKTPEYLAKFPKGKIPALETPSGFLLTESSAIASYVAASGPKAEQLVGGNNEERAKVLEWVSFADMELLPDLSVLVKPLIGWAPLVEEVAAEKGAAFDEKLSYLEAHLKGRQFLVDDRHVSLADLSVAGTLFIGFRFYIDRPMREKFPILTAWYLRVVEIKEVEDAFGKVELLETRPTPPESKVIG